MVRIAVLSDFNRAFGADASDDKAEAFRLRHRWWQTLAADAGWDLAVIDSGLLRADPSLIRNASVCFIDTPLLLPTDYRVLWGICQQHSAPGQAFDPPDDVERVLSLAGDYQIVRGAHFEKIRTALIPISDDSATEIHTPEDVERLLGNDIDSALSHAGPDLQSGAFVRGFYASLRNQHPVYFFAQTRPQLVATCLRVVKGLRKGFAVGGLAIRQYLGLEQVKIPGGSTSLEIRLTIVGGRLIAASYQGPYEDLDDEQRAVLADRLHELNLAGMVKEAGQELIASGLPANFVADLVFVKGAAGRPVLSEFNPLYSSGYRVPLARAWVQTTLGAWLAERAGYAPVGLQELHQMAVRLVGPSVGSGAVVWPESLGVGPA